MKIGNFIYKNRDDKKKHKIYVVIKFTSTRHPTRSFGSYYLIEFRYLTFF